MQTLLKVCFFFFFFGIKFQLIGSASDNYAHYHQPRNSIDFWYIQKLNLKSFINMKKF